MFEVSFNMTGKKLIPSPVCLWLDIIIPTSLGSVEVGKYGKEKNVER